jgi:hypothetical protein
MKAARAVLVVIIAVVVLLLAAGPASAAQTQRVSVATGGAQANHNSTTPAITPDGRYVAFQSFASNLVTGDVNGLTDVFVRDRQTGATELVSVHTDGTQANSVAAQATISADGRYVAFESFASNLVDGDTNGKFDVFVHDRQTGVTQRVNVASDGAQAEGDDSGQAVISADGRYVAFQSFADNLVPGDNNGFGDVFVHDRQTGATERVNVATNGSPGNSGAGLPAISADGRYVAFVSNSSNLVADDDNDPTDIFVHDRQADTTERVSVANGGIQANNSSFGPAISADGRHVAFTSQATNLVAGDTNGVQDIFVHDRQADTTQRVSVATNGTQANLDSFATAISADGRYVAFTTQATNLTGGDVNGINPDVFVHDRQTHVTERVSVATSGTQANRGSDAPSISADGTRVAFWSDATNLVAGDTNGRLDVFVRIRAKACSDEADNDADGQTDYPSDPGCTSATDNSEVNPQCNDGIDNDNDGVTDHPSDPGCTSLADNSEINPQCNDGRDNDGDGVTDYPADAGCTSLADNNETNPQCNDGQDNDGDGATDYPGDAGCASLADNNESTQCSDGQDNDGDGATDFPADAGCASLADNNETNPQCNDGRDNDGDGAADFPADAGCASLASNNESPQCSDGQDNDSDGLTDHPNDPGCTSPADNSEFNPQCNDGKDNDTDGASDYPNDPGCTSLADNSEVNPQCNDGKDNDNDGFTDYPNDPGCRNLADNSE